MFITTGCIFVVGGLVVAGTAYVARIWADGVVDIIRDSNKNELQQMARSHPALEITPTLPEVFHGSNEGGLFNIIDSGGGSCQINQTKTRIRRLVTLEDHRWLLATVLRNARRRVVIISPQISAGAIRADNIDSLIAYAVERGVDVVVFTDYALNQENGLPKASALEGKKMIEQAGARVLVLDRIHHKTLIGDDDLLADGSFNWLSAVRKSNHVHQREERSKVTVGEAARGFIGQELQRMMQVSASSSVRALN